jgi:ABC-2 type transport system permease protein
MVTYVTAHEIAHQWWGHQVIGADQQGSTLLSESFAQYSALLVMEQLYGKEQIRRFLKYELDRYLRSRGGELIEELPLARVENQPYIHYQKGSAGDVLAEGGGGRGGGQPRAAAPAAAARLQARALPRSTDFLRLLREEAGPQHDALITDLFERITLVDAKATAARATKRADGRWDLVLDVEARKLQADGKGGDRAAAGRALRHRRLQRRAGQEGLQAGVGAAVRAPPHQHRHAGLTLVVDRQPRWAGVDPYNKRIDRNSDDNLQKVDMP